MRLVHILSVGCLFTVAGLASSGGPFPATAQSGQRPATAALDSAHGTVFPKRLVAGLLHQCSRPTPDDVVGYWTPTSVQVAALEAGLQSMLAAPDYYRQYGGLVHRGGRRTIYVNAFPRFLVDAHIRYFAKYRDHPERLLNFPPGSRDANWWRSVPGIVCDGGDAYFGVEFDPVTGRFESLHFNGNG